MATFSDNFNRADGALGSNWTSVGTLGALAIFSNQVRAGSLPGPFANIVAPATATFSADQESSLTVATAVSNDFVGPLVRVDATNGTGYGIYGRTINDNTMRLFRFVNASRTLIGSTNLIVANGDVLLLRAVGTTISAYKNGVLHESVTDSTYATGQPGITYQWDNNRGARGDDFVAADVAPPPSGPARSVFPFFLG
jgi:hypothetical protein